MRTAKRILLVGKDEDKLGVLRFVFRNARQGAMCLYFVASANSGDKALDLLAVSRYDALIVLSPIRAQKAFLEAAKTIDERMAISILTEVHAPLGRKYPEHILYRPCMTELLERVRKAITQKARHRGPAKGSPSALRCGEWRIGKKMVNGVYVAIEEKAT